MKSTWLNLAFLPLLLLACGERYETAKAHPVPVDTPPPPKPVKGEPYSFKNFKLGMTLNEFMKMKPNVHFSDPSGKYSVAKWINTSIADVKCKVCFVFEDYKDKGKLLNWFFITFEKTHYETVKIALMDKFGMPKDGKTVTKVNGFGSKIESDQIEWNNGACSICLEEIGSKINESEINFFYYDLGKSMADIEKDNKKKKDI